MERNKVFVHAQSGKFYQVIEYVNTDGNMIIKYERLGDGKNYQLAFDEFTSKFRQPSEEEYEALTKALPTLQAAGKVASLESVRQVLETGTSGVGILIEPDERDTFEHLVLYPDVEVSIKMGLNKIQKYDMMNTVWKISQGKNRDKRLILNFWGMPGTGKTQAARCIAKLLGKKLYQVDYSQVISKWVGDTAKHISAVFAEAKKHDAVLFWDEADSLVSKRVSGGMDQAYASSVNQNRNTLMQELDRFNGVVVMTTNLFKNYDEAILRRVAQHVEFKLPNAEMREKILKLHITNADRVKEVDYKALTDFTEGFSGGDMLNLWENSRDQASLDENPDNWFITQEIFMSEAKKLKEAKKHHKGGVERRPIGLKPSVLQG